MQAEQEQAQLEDNDIPCEGDQTDEIPRGKKQEKRSTIKPEEKGEVEVQAELEEQDTADAGEENQQDEIPKETKQKMKRNILEEKKELEVQSELEDKDTA